MRRNFRRFSLSVGKVFKGDSNPLCQGVPRFSVVPTPQSTVDPLILPEYLDFRSPLLKLRASSESWEPRTANDNSIPPLADDDGGQ